MNKCRSLWLRELLSCWIGWPFFATFIGGLRRFRSRQQHRQQYDVLSFQFGVGERILVDPTWIVALQAVGGASGNIICVHNVVAASAVAGLIGREGAVIRKTCYRSSTMH